MSTETDDIVFVANKSLLEKIKDTLPSGSTIKKCALALAATGIVASTWYFGPGIWAWIMTELTTCIITVANWISGVLYNLYLYIDPTWGVFPAIAEAMQFLVRIAKLPARLYFDAVAFAAQSSPHVSQVLATTRTVAGFVHNVGFSVDPIVDMYRIVTMMFLIFFFWALNKIYKNIGGFILSLGNSKRELYDIPNIPLTLFKAAFRFANFVWKTLILVGTTFYNATKGKSHDDDDDEKIKRATQECADEFVKTLHELPIISFILTNVFDIKPPVEKKKKEGKTETDNDEEKQKPLLDTRIKDSLSVDEVSVDIGVNIRSIRITPDKDDKTYRFADGTEIRKGVFSYPRRLCRLNEENVDDIALVYANPVANTERMRVNDIAKESLQRSLLNLKNEDDAYIRCTKLLTFYGKLQTKEEIEDIISFCQRPQFSTNVKERIETLKDISIRGYMLKSIWNMFDEVSQSELFKNLRQNIPMLNVLYDGEIPKRGSSMTTLHPIASPASQSEIQTNPLLFNPSFIPDGYEDDPLFKTQVDIPKALPTEDNSSTDTQQEEDAKKLEADLQNMNVESRSEYKENLKLLAELSDHLQKVLPEIKAAIDVLQEDGACTQGDLNNVIRNATTSREQTTMGNAPDISSSSSSSSSSTSTPTLMDIETKNMGYDLFLIRLETAMQTTRKPDKFTPKPEPSQFFPNRYAFSSLDYPSKLLLYAYEYIRHNDLTGLKYPTLPHNGQGQASTMLLPHAYNFHKVLSRLIFAFSFQERGLNIMTEKMYTHTNPLPSLSVNTANSTNPLFFPRQRRFVHDNTNLLMLPLIDMRMGIFSIPNTKHKDINQFVSHTQAMIMSTYDETSQIGSGNNTHEANFFDVYGPDNATTLLEKRRQGMDEFRKLLAQTINVKDIHLDFLRSVTSALEPNLLYDMLEVGTKTKKITPFITNEQSMSLKSGSFIENILSVCDDHDFNTHSHISLILGLDSENLGLRGEIYLFAYQRRQLPTPDGQGSPVEMADMLVGPRLAQTLENVVPVIMLKDADLQEDTMDLYDVGILYAKTPANIVVHHLPRCAAYIKQYKALKGQLFCGFFVDMHEVLLACGRLHFVHTKTPSFRKFQCFSDLYLNYDPLRLRYDAKVPEGMTANTDLLRRIQTAWGLNSIISWVIRLNDIYRECIDQSIRLTFTKSRTSAKNNKNQIRDYNSQQYDVLVEILTQKAQYCQDLLKRIEDRLPKNLWSVFCENTMYQKYHEDVAQVGRDLENLAPNFARLFYDDTDELL
jgi:hypothetical protein